MRHSICISAERLPVRKGWFLPSKSPVRVKAASMPIASFAPAAQHEQHSRDQVCAWWGLPSTCNTERFPLPHLSSNLPPKLRHQQQDNQKIYIPKLFLFCFVLFYETYDFLCSNTNFSFQPSQKSFDSKIMFFYSHLNSFS